MSLSTNFTMTKINGGCPICGNQYMLYKLSGKNVGDLNIKCTNCNSYFKENEIDYVVKPIFEDRCDNCGRCIYSTDTKYTARFGMTELTLCENCVTVRRGNDERRIDEIHNRN